MGDLEKLSKSGPSSKKTMLQMVELWQDKGIAGVKNIFLIKIQL